MKSWLVSGFLLASVLSVALCAGVPSARASEPYEKATGLKCDNCHKHTKEQFKEMNIKGFDATQDYKDCGKECADFLKKQKGYAALTKGQERSKADAKKWADLLVDKDWKCSKQSAPGKPLK